MRHNNDDAIKAQVIYYLGTHTNTPFDSLGIRIAIDTFNAPLSSIVKDLEAIIATAQAALATIDEMREPPMDLDETAGMK